MAKFGKVLRVLDTDVTATFIDLRGSSHALVSIPSANANSFDTGSADVCYVNRAPLEGKEPGHIFTLPAGELVAKIGDDGEVMTSKDGDVLSFYRAPQS